MMDEVGALNKAKLEASVRGERAKSTQKRRPNPYAIASGLFLLLSFLKYFYLPLQWLALIAVGLVIFPIALRAWTAVRHLTFGNIHILVLIAAAGSIALHDYLEAGAIVFLFTIAEWLESLASHEATDAMSSLVNLLPQRAVLAETGEEVDVSEVQVNTVLSVKEGERVPVDGVVLEGNCEVDEKSLSGEPFPVAKQEGSVVWAGTINVNGYIAIRTTTLAEDSALARMTKLVEEAHGKKSLIQRYIDKCVKYYTPVIILISASLAIFPAALKLRNQKQWFHIALVVLVSACPCALVLSTPIAMFCALTKAAKHGVFFKGADCLETLAKVKIMAFDKTGTVTRAEFEVIEFRSLSEDITLNTLLYWVSSIQSKSSHPIAAALVDYAQSQSVQPKPDEVKKYQNFPGEGIYGRIGGNEIYIGNWKISARAGCKSVPKLEGDMYEGKSVGYVFLGSTPVGVFCLADVCRTGAKEALKELKSMGIKTVMLTGDCHAAAKHTEDQLGGALEVVHSDLLPEDKATFVKGFQRIARTAMIGDGINDSLALATADVGISMGISGSALATETGDVILMTNDIQRIPKVARLARRVRRKILENMVLSVAAKGSVIALAVAGHPVVWAAVLADAGTCLLVIFNSMILLRETTKGPMEYCKSAASSRVEKAYNKCSGRESWQGKKPCCGEIDPLREPLICSFKNSVPAQYSGASVSIRVGNDDRDLETGKASCCQNGKESGTVNCSNSGGVFKCCKSLNMSGENVSLTKECGIYQGSNSSEEKETCCGNRKPRQKEKCSNPGDANNDSNSINISGDTISLGQNCGGNQRPGSNEKQGCCKNRKQNPSGEVNCSNSINMPGDGCCGKECGNAQRSSSFERLGCCGNGKYSQKAKCSDPGEFNCLGSINVPGDDLEENPKKLDTVQTYISKNSAPTTGQSDGCCDYFRKECCVQNGHCCGSFGEPLSEIVIIK
ncbi:OLC1v1002165C1 [Oldenlandia corymbosa var. corymbosa]|uniref:OLC1v1002165C1 n=1 Tax=Oldenlandia corymbosa var. corymbosa TaxID=529605 RepID=A0AAV1D7N6_OLDCO|nr:OLC1v1002165C1 [Oldenlandia corymbosa var. corymbosa]